MFDKPGSVFGWPGILAASLLIASIDLGSRSEHEPGDRRDGVRS